jgi:hypothetical protein
VQSCAAARTAAWLRRYASSNRYSTHSFRPIMKDDPDRWDPREVGPIGLCIHCFEPKSEERTYCLRCGHHSGFFGPRGDQHRHRCYKHPQAQASNYCTLCDRPICQACLEREGLSLLGGFSTPQCHDCVAEMERLESSFLPNLLRTGKCAKHSHKRAISKCMKCDSPLCDSRAYFKRKGLLFRKTGPYCLACYRLER